MGTAKKENAGRSTNGIDAPTSALGKRSRTPVEAMDAGEAADGNIERRPRGEALEVALSTDLEVVKEHAQWRNPELKPTVGSNRSSVAEGVDGAVSAWVAGECDRVLGQELPPGAEEQNC